jgi:hypothetical protein
MKEKMGPHAFAEFEKELHERMMEAERDIVAAEMARLDADADAIVIDGKVHRRVLRQSQTYMTSAGEVVVERTLYKDRKDEDGRCVRPMELTLGVVGDFWTPRAAQQALWVVTQMTPKKGAELFERLSHRRQVAKISRPCRGPSVARRRAWPALRSPLGTRAIGPSRRRFTPARATTSRPSSVSQVEPLQSVALRGRQGRVLPSHSERLGSLVRQISSRCEQIFWTVKPR